MSKERSSAVWIALAGAVLLVLVGLFALLHNSQPPALLPPTAEESAYFSRISVTGARMSAAQNLIGDTITYLDFQVTNQGAKAVRTLRLQLEFVDVMGQLVLRDEVYPVSARTPLLTPGMTRAWRVSYGHMPADWNQGPPRVTVTYVGF